jgi:hypothetical protein
MMEGALQTSAHDGVTALGQHGMRSRDREDRAGQTAG